MAAIAEALSTKETPVRETRRQFGFTQEEFARLMDCTPRSIAAWEAGQAISKHYLKRLKEVGRLYEMLARVTDPDKVGLWIDTENPAFDGLKPMEVIARGEIDRLWRMIFHLEAGVGS